MRRAMGFTACDAALTSCSGPMSSSPRLLKPAAQLFGVHVAALACWLRADSITTRLTKMGQSDRMASAKRVRGPRVQRHHLAVALHPDHRERRCRRAGLIRPRASHAPQTRAVRCAAGRASWAAAWQTFQSQARSRSPRRCPPRSAEHCRPLTSFSTIMGMLVTGSIIRPRMRTSMSSSIASRAALGRVRCAEPLIPVAPLRLPGC